MINDAKDFAEYANKIINGISCLYLAENEIIAETEDIEMSPKIRWPLKVHEVLRTYNEDNICKQNRFTFSGTGKRSTRKFVGTISFY